MMIGKTEQLAAGSRKKVEEFSSFLDKIKEKIQTQPPSEVMNYILDNSGWRISLEQEATRDRALNNDNSESIERLENLAELINVAAEFDSFEAPLGVEKLLEEAALMSEQDSLKNSDGKSAAVTMMTIHASKGLEFDHVFITGLEEGLFPSDRSDSARDSEEERRLFYVALTRARAKAWLSYATMRHKFGSLTFNMPSEFITEIDPLYLDNKSGIAAVKNSGGRGLLDDIEF
jgi:DNA helicase-2/ATP-dependent DNA helicase PcrA